MGQVARRAGKCHLQLTRHLLRADKAHQVFSCCLRPGKHIKIFILLHSGKRAAGDIAREISAASHGNDSHVHSLLHNVRNNTAVQIMKLNGLAGSKVRLFQIVLPNGIRNKFQFFLCYTAAGHAQTQHACLTALLGIASVQSGKSFVSVLAEFSCVKRCSFFPESRKILLPVLVISNFHNTLLLM